MNDIEIDAKPLLKLTVSLAQKVAVAPYESADVSLFISGITIEHTDEEIADIIARGDLVYVTMANRLKSMVKEARGNKGWGGI